MVVDETLLHSVDVARGIKDGGALIINTGKDQEEIRPLLNGYEGSIYTLDAERISMETMGKNFPNTPMLAAAVKVSNLIEEERFVKDMEESFRHKFSHKPHLIEGNMAALKMSLKEVQ